MPDLGLESGDAHSLAFGVQGHDLYVVGFACAEGLVAPFILVHRSAQPDIAVER